jgi:hypothetical protein
MWIVQEMLLAHRPVLHCCSARMEWERLTSFRNDFEMLLQRPGLAFKTIYDYRRLLEIMAMRLDRKREGKSEMGLIDLLHAFQDCQCQTPKNKVYALLSWAQDCQRREIVADYAKSDFELYEEVIGFFQARASTSLAMFSRLLQKMLGLFFLPHLRPAIPMPQSFEVPAHYFGRITGSLSLYPGISPDQAFHGLNVCPLATVSCEMSSNAACSPQAGTPDESSSTLVSAYNNIRGTFPLYSLTTDELGTREFEGSIPGRRASTQDSNTPSDMSELTFFIIERKSKRGGLRNDDIGIALPDVHVGDLVYASNTEGDDRHTDKPWYSEYQNLIFIIRWTTDHWTIVGQAILGTVLHDWHLPRLFTTAKAD